MDIELIKRMMDACYQGKRIRDMLPPLPDGVASSFIQYLDIIEKLEKQGIRVKISDVSDALSPVSYTHLDVYKRQPDPH